MSALKNGVLLRNRKAENRPLMKVIYSLLLLAPCLSALMISCCKYFLITVKLSIYGGFSNMIKVLFVCNGSTAGSRELAALVGQNGANRGSWESGLLRFYYE